MKTIQLINYIASHPEFTNVVIKDMDDKKPMQAIELLSSESFDNIWAINGTLECGTLLVYDKSQR
jgi:hypothetical protein